MNPLLSVIIPVFNGRRYLRSAVESVLKEGLPTLELIVVDDGSTDGTIDTIADLSVIKIRMDSNRGQAAAQNIGISNARGTYLAFLDSDDLLCENGLKWRLEWLLRNDHESVVAGKIAGIIDADGKSLGSYKNVLNPRYESPPSYISLKYLASGGEFPSQMWNLLFRRKFLLEVGAFDENLQCAHDNDYFYRILSQSYIPYIGKPTVFYRMHDRNLSGFQSPEGFQYRPEVLAENLMVHLSHGILPRS